MDPGDGERLHAAHRVHGLAPEVDAGRERAVQRDRPAAEHVEPAAEHLARRLDDHDPHVVAGVEPGGTGDQPAEQRIVDHAAAVGAVDAQPAHGAVGRDGNAVEVVSPRAGTLVPVARARMPTRVRHPGEPGWPDGRRCRRGRRHRVGRQRVPISAWPSR